MAEFTVGGQRVTVDTSDSPSSAELQKRIEQALAAQTAPTPAPADAVEASTPQATQQPVEQEEAGFLDHVAEIPEGIAAGATKALANTSTLVDRVTGGKFGEMNDWLNENVANLGYIHIDGDGSISWTDGKIDTDAPDEEDKAIELFDTTTITGDITEGISQFATGLLMTRGAGFAGNSTASLVGQGVVAENLAFSPWENRLSNLVQEFPSLENPVTDYLSADPEDSEVEARFKMSLEALGVEAVAGTLFAGVRAYRNYSKGLEADPEDMDSVQAWADAQAPDVDVNLAELDEKMAKAVEAEAVLRETYEAADRSAGFLTPETIANIKAGARKDAVEETPDTIVEKGAKLYGYGVTKTNDELVRQADDVLAEAFVDSPSVLRGIQNLKDSMEIKDFDIYVTAAGRVLQMTTRNLAKSHQGLKNAEENLRSNFEQLDARTDLTPDEIIVAKQQLQDEFLPNQNTYRQIRNDYIESVMAFRGGATTAGRAVQVNKLFQNFDVPPHQVEAHFDQILRKLPNDKVRNSFVARAVFTLNKKTGDVLKALDEIFIANILTGIKTHVVNTVGNGATTLYLPLERAAAAGIRVLGGDVKGGAKQFRAAMATYTGMRHSLNESMRLSVEAYRIGNTLLDTNTTYEGASRTTIGRDLPFEKHTLTELSKFIQLRESEITLSDLLGTAMRALSTRGLSAEDEFFKNLNFRSYSYGNAYVDALDTAGSKGLKGAEARAFAQEQAGISVQRAVDEQMMLGRNNMPFDLGVEPYRADSLQYGREATYTQNLSKGGSSFQGMVEHVPLMRQIFPFVRTPLNLISASMQRSPLAPLSGRWRDDFIAGGERRSLALTRLALGTAIVTKFMSDFTDQEATFERTGKKEGVEFLGAGPTLVGARQNQQEIGGKIFGSLVTADGTQYQISRFDPFSTIFEGLGVIQDLHRNGQTDEADDLTLTYGLAIARMFGNDTYATSIRQIMYAMQDENGLDKFLKGRAGQMVPLSGFTKGYNQAVDPFQRELRSYTDAIMASLPGGSSTLAPKYNLLGEPVEAPKYATTGLLPKQLETMASPIMSGKVKTDPVAVEIVNQNITTVKQSPLLKGGVVDLNDERFATDALGKPIYEDNRTAYDRFNDIMATERFFGNLTLREYLNKTVESGVYQDRLTDSVRADTPFGRKSSVMYEGSRKDILTAIIADAKEYALVKLRKENPNLDAALKLHEQNKGLAFSEKGQDRMKELNAPLEGN